MLDSGEKVLSQSERKDSVMKYKLIYTGMILFVYTVGRCIPIYGIDISTYSLETINAEDLLMQTMSGDAYRTSIFALGIFPYMMSSLFVQIAMACRNLVSNVKTSPKKVNRISVMLTLAFGIIQAFFQVPTLKFNVINDLFPVEIIAILEMVTGAMFIMWMSDRIAKYGLGGRMIFALVNILERFMSTLSSHTAENLAFPLIMSAVVMIIMMILENAEKRIPVQRISIHNIYADKNYMAVKLNPVGVMPVMFSTIFFMLPKLVVFVLRSLFPNHLGIIWWQNNLSLTCPLGIAVYIACLYLLTIIFAMVMLNPKEITEQFLKSGDSIVDIHAGRDTRRYLRGVMCRLSVFSATVMSVCVGVPLVLQLEGNIDSTLAMLPSSVMMLTGLWCNLYREAIVIRNYDSYRPLF